MLGSFNYLPKVPSHCRAWEVILGLSLFSGSGLGWFTQMISGWLWAPVAGFILGLAVAFLLIVRHHRSQ